MLREVSLAKSSMAAPCEQLMYQGRWLSMGAEDEMHLRSRGATACVTNSHMCNMHVTRATEVLALVQRTTLDHIYKHHRLRRPNRGGILALMRTAPQHMTCRLSHNRRGLRVLPGQHGSCSNRHSCCGREQSLVVMVRVAKREHSHVITVQYGKRQQHDGFR